MLRSGDCLAAFQCAGWFGRGDETTSIPAYFGHFDDFTLCQFEFPAVVVQDGPALAFELGARLSLGFDHILARATHHDVRPYAPRQNHEAHAEQHCGNSFDPRLGFRGGSRLGPKFSTLYAMIWRKASVGFVGRQLDEAHRGGRLREADAQHVVDNTENPLIDLLQLRSCVQFPTLFE